MPHYYDAKQEGDLRPFRIRVQARGIPLELWSGSGVFSKNELDAGTRLLIDECTIEPGWRVHDLGCGIGVVGIIAKLAQPSCEVVCSDVSERAVELCRRNAREHAQGVRVVLSDGYASIDEEFDTVLLNPPYVAGREMVFSLIDQAHAHLVAGGVLQVVARHSKGGEMIKRRLVETFGACDDSRRRGGFRIYASRKE